MLKMNMVSDRFSKLEGVIMTVDDVSGCYIMIPRCS